MRKLIETLKHAGRFSAKPTYSLFVVDSRGEYTLLGTSSSCVAIASQFYNACLATCNVGDGLELRCDGVKVQLS